MHLKVNIQGTVTKEAIGPFRTYHLSRGLTLKFNPADAVVSGGTTSSLAYQQMGEPDDFGLLSSDNYSEMLRQAERDIGVRLVGATGSLPDDILFRVDNSVISGEWLAEELLGKLTHLDSLIRRRVLVFEGLSEVALQASREICANIHDQIWAGHVGPNALDTLIDKLKSTVIPIREAFFVFNAQSIADDMRNSILAACHHFADMTSRIWNVNQGRHLSPSSGKELSEGQEIVYSSGEVDALSFAYTSTVIACYTSLELLYELFVYLTREPFVNPDFPSNLHFPDVDSSPIFRNGGKALPDDPPSTTFPHAIPNLARGTLDRLGEAETTLYIAWHRIHCVQEYMSVGVCCQSTISHCSMSNT